MVNERVLQVVIRARDEASKQLGATEKKLGGFGKAAVGGIGAAIAVGTAVAAGLNKAADAASSYGAQVVAVQRLTGASAEQSSQFAAMLDRVGVNGKGVGLIMKSVSTAIAGNSKGLRDAGIATKDANGKNRDAMSVVRDLADYYSKAKDKTAAVALASKVLGRGYQSMLPILAGGADGIDKLNKKAQEAGLILGQDQVDAVKKYGAALKDQQQAEKGLEVQIGLLVLPLKTLITGWLTKFVGWLREKLPGAIKWFKDAWAKASDFFARAGEFFNPLMAVLTFLWRNVLAPIGQFIGTQFKQAWVELKAAWAQLAPQLKPLMPVLKVVGAVMLAIAVGPILILVAAIAGVAAGIAFVIKWVAKGINWFVRFETSVKKSVAGIVGVGKSIVSGLWSGIKNQWDTLRRNVGGLFTGLVAWIKRLLGIHSPSTVFAGIGKNLALGLNLGYDSALSPLGVPALAGAGGGSVAGGGYAGGRQEIHIYIDGRELNRALGRTVVHDERSGRR